VYPSHPVDPGYGQGHPLPPYATTGPVYPPVIWPHPPRPVDPGYGQGWPLPPYAGGGPVYPPYVGGGPVYPPRPIFPQPPPPDKPGPPGPDPIEIGDKGWTIQYWRGMGWVLVPPEPETPEDQPQPKKT